MLLAAALALGLVATGCGDDNPAIQSGGGGHEDQGEGHESQGVVDIGGEEATNHGSADVAGSTSFELELDDNYFGPTVLEGDAGQTLTVQLHNEGDATHTFTIDGVVDEELAPGTEDVSADVTFPDDGALVFYCRFHRGSGMLGALSVGGALDVAPAADDDTSEDGSGDDSGGSGYPGYGGG
jgi:plastocyanin